MMWSYSDWVESKSFYFKTQWDFLIRSMPYFIGYFMILGAYASTKPMFPSDIWGQFLVLAQIASPGVLVASIGILMIERWRDKVKGTSIHHKPIQLEIWWDEATMFIDNTFI